MERGVWPRAESRGRRKGGPIGLHGRGAPLCVRLGTRGLEACVLRPPAWPQDLADNPVRLQGNRVEEEL